MFLPPCIIVFYVNAVRRNLHAYTYGAQRISLHARTICVEADISPGIYSFSIIGLPDKAVDEARERVSTALKHSGFTSPKYQNQKVVISLAPGDLKKTGTLFDVSIALTYLLATGVVRFDPEKKMFIGELSLDGSLQRAKGILPLLRHAKENGFEEVYIPSGNESEASLIDGVRIIPCSSLATMVSHLRSETIISPVKYSYTPRNSPEKDVGFESIKGQDSVKRALTIAGAGGHNIALYGPPGTGKTLLARSLVSILPPLTTEECVEVTALHSITDSDISDPVSVPPFRNPHHTSSYASIVGGGALPRPGEISLAHRGVLFLDEFPEFDRRVIESLREPLEEHSVTVTRAGGSVKFPASCILVVAFNLCPCGNTGTDKICECSVQSKMSYHRKLSGPIADRIDVWVSVEASDFEELERKQDSADTAYTSAVKKSVQKARTIQRDRYADVDIILNSEAGARTIESHIAMPPASVSVLQSAATKLSLSPRGYHRTVKCARTVADVEGDPVIQPHHVLEAVSYRTPPL